MFNMQKCTTLTRGAWQQVGAIPYRFIRSSWTKCSLQTTMSYIITCINPPNEQSIYVQFIILFIHCITYLTYKFHRICEKTVFNKAPCHILGSLHRHSSPKPWPQISTADFPTRNPPHWIYSKQRRQSTSGKTHNRTPSSPSQLQTQIPSGWDNRWHLCCPAWWNTAPHMKHWEAHNLSNTEDLGKNLVGAIAYLCLTGLLGQTDRPQSDNNILDCWPTSFSFWFSFCMSDRLASKEVRYSFFFFLERLADSRFLIILCCLLNALS